jgi:hypothetical protein
MVYAVEWRAGGLLLLQGFVLGLMLDGRARVRWRVAGQGRRDGTAVEGRPGRAREAANLRPGREGGGWRVYGLRRRVSFVLRWRWVLGFGEGARCRGEGRREGRAGHARSARWRRGRIRTRLRARHDLGERGEGLPVRPFRRRLIGRPPGLDRGDEAGEAGSGAGVRSIAWGEVGLPVIRGRGADEGGGGHVVRFPEMSGRWFAGRLAVVRVLLVEWWVTRVKGVRPVGSESAFRCVSWGALSDVRALKGDRDEVDDRRRRRWVIRVTTQ